MYQVELERDVFKDKVSNLLLKLDEMSMVKTQNELLREKNQDLVSGSYFIIFNGVIKFHCDCHHLGNSSVKIEATDQHSSSAEMSKNGRQVVE